MFEPSSDVLDLPNFRMSFTVEQNRIKQLCTQMLSAEDEAEIRRLSAELQTAIHEQIESLRRKVVEIPAERGSFVVGEDEKAS